MRLNYLMPARILMDENCLAGHRDYLAGLGKKALVVTGRHSARTNGAYNDAVKALKDNGQDHVLYDQVMTNPTDTCVFEAGELARKTNCDFVLALGGGSPMDAAKAAAVLGLNDISKEEMYSLSFADALPIAAVPTTAGTGSETTPYSVLVDTTEADGKTPRLKGPVKRSFGSPLLFPRCAFLDVKYLLGLNRDLTVNTAIDALCHAIEGMLTLKANYLSDMLARQSIAMIMDCMQALAAFPEDPRCFPVEIRKKLLLASCVAGMVIAQSGTTVVHSMGYVFTLNWGTDHGRANFLLLRSFLSWCREKEKAACTPEQRIPGVCAALGMELERFFDLLEKLLGQREKASDADLKAWGSLPMKNAANTYIQPNQEDISRMFRESVVEDSCTV